MTSLVGVRSIKDRQSEKGDKTVGGDYYGKDGWVICKYVPTPGTFYPTSYDIKFGELSVQTEYWLNIAWLRKVN